MPLDSLGRDIAELFEEAAPEITLDELHRIDLQRQSRRISVSPWFAAASAFVLVLALGSVIWSLSGPSDPSTGPVPLSEPSPSTSSTVEIDSGPVRYRRVLGLAYPPNWHRAGSELMPALGFRSVTVATMALRPGGDRCAQVPENAMRDMSGDDVLLTVFFRGTIDPESPPLPEILDESTFPTSQGTDAEECAEREDLEIHWGDFTVGEESLYVLLVFGEDVEPSLRQTAWEVLESLQWQTEVPGGGGQVCVVTKPGVPGFTPPPPYNPEPSSDGGEWYGTAELWTVLNSDGSYPPRKSVWWSTNFQGGAVEPSPELEVTWRRLFESALVIEGERTTNAFTPQDGSFMIAGFDPPHSGCWEVTATYKGATLRYIYEKH